MTPTLKKLNALGVMQDKLNALQDEFIGMKFNTATKFILEKRICEILNQFQSEFVARIIWPDFGGQIEIKQIEIKIDD